MKITTMLTISLVIILFFNVSSTSRPAPNNPVSQTSCVTDADCGCGTNINTGACFVGNKKYVDTFNQCPDYCSGFAGNLVTKCVRRECIITTATTTTTLLPTTTTTLVSGGGWYDCNGNLIAYGSCDSRCNVSCKAVGTRSEGWYDCNMNLISYANCRECSASCKASGTRRSLIDYLSDLISR